MGAMMMMRLAQASDRSTRYRCEAMMDLRKGSSRWTSINPYAPRTWKIETYLSRPARIDVNKKKEKRKIWTSQRIAIMKSRAALKYQSVDNVLSRCRLQVPWEPNRAPGAKARFTRGFHYQRLCALRASVIQPLHLFPSATSRFQSSLNWTFIPSERRGLSREVGSNQLRLGPREPQVCLSDKSLACAWLVNTFCQNILISLSVRMSSRIHNPPAAAAQSARQHDRDRFNAFGLGPNSLPILSRRHVYMISDSPCTVLHRGMVVWMS
ncbi:hypothetical protein B0H66DRAFT_83031 [Apodospora peruviana]|uniref:Uncharacterized protein n=1 Tax=Apodospora peruviana TaxID=516989 RepID=A0AAE0MGM1_9PEZI|nr:hypothetical protein B0H66DRAFT_83031 [Apodospora peruviana]